MEKFNSFQRFELFEFLQFVLFLIIAAATEIQMVAHAWLPMGNYFTDRGRHVQIAITLQNLKVLKQLHLFLNAK